MSRYRRHSPPGGSRRGAPMNPHSASTGSLPGMDGMGGGGGPARMGGGPMMMGGPGGGMMGGGPMGHHGGGGRGGPIGPGGMPPMPGGYHDGVADFFNPPPSHHPSQYAGPPPHHHHGAPPPAAPPAPHSGQPTPYSTHPHSPTSSSENLAYYPPAPAPPQHYSPGPPPPRGFHSPPPPPGPGHYGVPPPHAPPPGPPGGHMRGGDGSLGRRNTTAGSRPSVHQPFIDQPDYHDYRAQRPVIHSHPRSQHGGRDISPPESSSGPFMVIPNSGGNVHRSQSYRPGSSGVSDGSYEGGDMRSHGQKGYLVSSGAGRPRRAKEREYQIARTATSASASSRRNQGTVYTLDRPPRRRERSLSRPPPSRAFSDDDYDEPPRQGRRMANGPPPSSMSGALVRPRSRSRSRPPPNEGSGALVKGSSSAGAGTLVKRRESSSDEDSGPSSRTIRVEVAGQAIDIAYSGPNGKPLIGNITINTTARTVTTEEAPAPAPAPQKALPAPEPAQKALPPPEPQQPLAILPAGIKPVFIPAPPQPGQMVPTAPAPPPPDMYHSMSNMHLNDPNPGAMTLSRPYRDDAATTTTSRSRRARSRSRPGSRARSRPGSRRARSRSRSRPPSAHDDSDPLWTKISRDIVSKRAVLVREYEYEEVPGAIIIYRVLNESEIDDLVDLSDRIRTGKVEVVRRSGASDSTSHRGGRPASIHGYPGQGQGSQGPGPSKERPPPGKPAIVSHAQRALPEAPPAPLEDALLDQARAAPAPPVTVTQTKGRGGVLRENPDLPGTYVGYKRTPPGAGRG
ncbi:hypothetical protein EDC01DRAFT_636564 [Geopyxis carbonaria]|nr:hypothetical protein EDC01DRAFT_636564 [Geopyxis carbonaria]